MLNPVQITFRDMEPSAALETRIRERTKRLDRVFDRITSCHIIVDAPHHHHHQGGLFHVRIDCTLPGREFVVGRDSAKHHAHEDAHVAVRDAFDALRRQLEDYTRRQHGQVKTHTAPEQDRDGSDGTEVGLGWETK